MSKIKIMQLLCPNRHLMAGVGFNTALNNDETAKAALMTGLRASGMTPVCAACGRIAENFEAKDTEFESMREVAPYIVAEQQKYARMRENIRQTRRMAANN